MNTNHPPQVNLRSECVTRSATTHPHSAVENNPPRPASSPSPNHSLQGGPSTATSCPEPGQSSKTVRAHVRKANLRRTLTATLLLSVIVYLVFRYAAYQQSWVSTDNAFLTGHIHAISSRIAGTVKEVLVDENQMVQAGTVLARLETSELELRRLQAVAQLAQAAAHIEDCQARTSQAEAQVAHEQARAAKAQNDLTRALALFEGGAGAISKQELDVAKSESAAAEASLRGAHSALTSAIASTTAARAQEKVARSGLQDAELQLSYSEILAPASGRIGRKNIEIGNRVAPGQALLAIVQPDVWVTANFKETQLNHLKPGQLARIKIDAFPGHVFRGTVDSLSPASGAQFALLPPDNATGNFTKIVQRVPLKILIDPNSLGDFAGRLVAGLSAVVEVQVRH